jgi:hypothetical protein
MALTISNITNTQKYLSGNDIWVKVHTSGATGMAYKILLQVISTDNLLFGSPFTPDEKIPDENGDAWFNISGIVDQHFDKSFQWPLSNKITGYNELAYDIRLKCGETFLNVLTLERTTNWGEAEGPFFIIKGALKPSETTQLNSLGSSFHAKYIAGGKWFSKLPLVQNVAPHQPVKLWWCPAGTASISFNVKGYYSDGTTDTKTATPELYTDILYEFDCQPANNGLVLRNSSKYLLYYEVTISGSVTLEKRTFIVDWNVYDIDFFLFVDNQIGGIECLWLHGAATFKASGDGSVSSRPLSRNAGFKFPTRISSGNSQTDKWTINSGYHPADELVQWKMILGKPQAWLAYHPYSTSGAIHTDLSNYTVIPVIIENNDLEMVDTMDNNFSVEIQLSEAH